MFSYVGDDTGTHPGVSNVGPGQAVGECVPGHDPSGLAGGD